MRKHSILVVAFTRVRTAKMQMSAARNVVAMGTGAKTTTNLSLRVYCDFRLANRTGK
jgi:hypothetical protein